MYSRKQLQYLYLIPHVSYFSSSCPNLHLVLGIRSEILLTKFDNELRNCNELDIFFVISSPFLLIILTSFSIWTVKAMYISVFSPRQVNCFLNYSANFIMIK